MKPLVLKYKIKNNIRLDMSWLSTIDTLNLSLIKNKKILLGNKRYKVSELFTVSGEDLNNIRLLNTNNNLDNIGSCLENKKLTIEGNIGPSVIIGTDCIDLTHENLENAFFALKEFDVVIGPAEDGGYYLIGMKKPIKELFENKKWSTESVFIDTIEDIKRLGLTHFTLPTLSDIDTLDDLKKSELYNYYEQFILRNN